MDIGCVDLTAPWDLNPRLDGSSIGDATPRDVKLATSGGLSMDAAATGGGISTGGAIVETGGATIDAQTSTGGTALIDAPIATGGTTVVDAPIEVGGIITTGGIAAQGGTTVIDAPVATGGVITTGGASGTGGSAVVYNCGSPYSLTGGTVTNFSDWNNATSTWGSSSRLMGNLSQYQSGGAVMSPVRAEGILVGMHLLGTVPIGSYGGGVMLFSTCTSLASYLNSNLLFDIYGKAPGCALELMVQTFDQRPIDADPAGTCRADAGADCYRFPGINVSLDSPTLPAEASAPSTVTKKLSDFRGWSAAKAVQVVGLQWQFTPKTNPAIDCYPDVTITNIRFQ